MAFISSSSKQKVLRSSLESLCSLASYSSTVYMFLGEAIRQLYISLNFFFTGRSLVSRKMRYNEGPFNFNSSDLYMSTNSWSMFFFSSEKILMNMWIRPHLGKYLNDSLRAETVCGLIIYFLYLILNDSNLSNINVFMPKIFLDTCNRNSFNTRPSE